MVLFERRRRDLNPCAAINDLLPFQGSPFGQLGYFSESINDDKSYRWRFYTISIEKSRRIFRNYPKTFLMLS